MKSTRAAFSCRPRGGWLPIGACLLALAQPAYAQPAGPGDWDRQAREHFANGEFAEAAKAFEAANRLSPHAATSYNAAMAWERAGDRGRAADDYGIALATGGLDAASEEAARRRLTVLNRVLCTVNVTQPVGGTATLAHATQVPVPAQIHVPPGDYTIVVGFPNGAKATRRVEARAGEVVAVAVAEPPSPAPPSLPRAEVRPNHAPIAEPVRRAGASKTARTWGLVSFSGAAACAGLAIWFGLQTLDAREDFEASGRTSKDARDLALSYRSLTNIAWGAAVVGTGLGVVLVLRTDQKSASSSQALPHDLHLRLAPQGAVAMMRF